MAHEVLQVELQRELYMLADLGAKAAILEAFEVDGQHIGGCLDGDLLNGPHLRTGRGGQQIEG